MWNDPLVAFLAVLMLVLLIVAIVSVGVILFGSGGRIQATVTSITHV